MLLFKQHTLLAQRQQRQQLQRGPLPAGGRPALRVEVPARPRLHQQRMVCAASAAEAEASDEAGLPPSGGVSTTSTSDPILAGEEPQNVKVFLAGATGGCGRRILECLVAANVPVRALVRSKADARPKLPASALDSELVEVLEGDVTQFNTLRRAAGDSNVVICATGASNIQDPLGPFNVDFQGTLSLLALSKQMAVNKFILVSSIGTEELFNPLNLFWGVLFWKRQAELEIIRSGLDYTIIRPGGLKSKLAEGQTAGNIVMKPPKSYGVPPLGQAGSILRSAVAELCVAAMYEPSAACKTVEVIQQKEAPYKTFAELFEGVEN